MLLAQRVDLTFTPSLSLSRRIADAPLSRWPSSRRLSPWETTQLADVVRPTSPLILDEEFAKAKIGAELPSTSPPLEDHEAIEELSTSFIPLLHPDLRKLCEGEESDAETEDLSKLEVDYVIPLDQLPSTIQIIDSEDESTYCEWDEHDEDPDIVPFLYSLRQNVFMESMNPGIAPHIIVTLCEDTWDDQNVAWYNRVDIQSPDYLHIPPTDISEFIAHPNHDYRVMVDLPPTPAPPRLFNLPNFQKLIDRSSVERLIMFEVILVLRKQLCRKVAFEASRLALSLRHRYNSQLPFEKFENSFRWTDPAESLLSCYRRYRGSTFIESPCPFRVPHIVVSAPPPENPWFKWSNQVSDPQDCGHGRYLVVPTRGIEFINEPEDPYHDSLCYSDAYEYGGCPGAIYTSTIESYRFFIVDDSEEDGVHYSAPETPIDRHEVEDFKTSFERALEFKFGKSPADPPLEDHHREPLDGNLSLARCGASSLIDEHRDMESDNDVPHHSRPSCRPHVLPLVSDNDWSSFNDQDDDNDDDLPPLDEWYQTVMRRTDATLQAG